MNKIPKIGDRIRIVESHMYAGQGGIVEDIKGIGADFYIHAQLDIGGSIILRPKQYEIVE